MESTLLTWAGFPKDVSEWELVSVALKTSRRVLLCSAAPGLGKTHAAIAAARGNFTQVTLNADLPVQSLEGSWIPSGTGEWPFRYGPVTSAMKDGRTLIINEVGRCSDAVLEYLLQVLDDSTVQTFTLPSGERITAHPDFRVVATSNDSVEDLATRLPALRSRFEVALDLSTPAPSLIATLNNRRRGLGTVLLNSFSDPTKALDPRAVLAWQALTANESVDPKIAALLAFGAKAPDFITALSLGGVL